MYTEITYVQYAYEKKEAEHMSKESTLLSNTLDKMETFFSRKYGIANSVSTGNVPLYITSDYKKQSLGNSIPMYTSAVGCATSALGGAISLNRDNSRIKAFGEFIERYCSSLKNRQQIENIIFDSYDNLTESEIYCLYPSDLMPFDEHQYENPDFIISKYNTATPISWVKGKNLTCNKECWIPAQKVFLNYPYAEGEKLHIYSLSTGLACGSSFEHAAVGGILEVIERDSFMLTWLLKRPGVKIEMDSIRNGDLRALYSHICKYLTGEDRLHIYDISKTNGVYTILTFIRNDLPSAYGLLISAASHIDPEIALLKSLEELCQCQRFAYSNLFKDEKKEIQNFTKQDITDLHKHFFYYSSSKHNSNIDFISSTRESINLSEMVNFAKSGDKETLEYLIQLLKKNGMHVYVADITMPEFYESGFKVIKAIIPGYIDLEWSHHVRQFNYSRLKMYQRKYNVDINLEPHPFP